MPWLFGDLLFCTSSGDYSAPLLAPVSTHDSHRLLPTHTDTHRATPDCAGLAPRASKLPKG